VILKTITKRSRTPKTNRSNKSLEVIFIFLIFFLIYYNVNKDNKKIVLDLQKKKQTMNSNISPKRAMTGLIFIAIGVLLILRNLNILSPDVSDVVFSWPMIFVAVGLITLANRNYTATVIMFSLASIFLLPKIFELPVNFWYIFWPAVFILIGISIISEKKNHAKIITDNEIQIVSSSASFEDSNVFSNSKKSFQGQSIENGRIVNIFGNSTIDLTNISTPSNKIKLEVVCVFGNVKLIIPKDWVVKNNIISILGSTSDKEDAILNDTNTQLSLLGKVVFGELKIVRK